jgi:hypothetical protein
MGDAWGSGTTAVTVAVGPEGVADAETTGFGAAVLLSACPKFVPVQPVSSEAAAITRTASMKARFRFTPKLFNFSPI